MEDGLRRQTAESAEFLSRCVSIDLEVDPNGDRIKSFAAIRPGKARPFIYNRGSLARALDELDDYADGAEFLLGHNIMFFDARHLAAKRSDLRILSKKVIDTLWLNPLAFPRHPYHRLVKHYLDGRLQAERVSEPLYDAELVFDVLKNQIDSFRSLDQQRPELLAALHWLAANDRNGPGFDSVFALAREAPRPNAPAAQDAVRDLLRERACTLRTESAISDAERNGWPLAYALSWVMVAGENSVMPPWVRHQFPRAGELVRELRDTPCSDPACKWCRSQGDPVDQLKTWFGFDVFRPRPAGPDGRSLQETIVAHAMSKVPILGILPTGTGKSICYQLPALAQYRRTGALTVVISPLVALMADQVAGLRRQGITACVTVNGMLSMPERQDALDQVRLGDAAILLISPEQLRSPSVRSILQQREVGYWVFDEAHCVSKWGHDFRPDYRYAARFIKEYSGESGPAPLVCLTATAKPGVIKDITGHFLDVLGIELQLIDGGAKRHNLDFEIVPTEKRRKHGDIVSVLQHGLPKGGGSGAIVYCSIRKSAEEAAEFLRSQGFSAAHYHAGLKPEEKRDVQQQFGDGSLRVIAATNAFGMGIDKPDIRLVVHADIPGSLENYLQEAGRAGRDGDAARCVLLFSIDDIERQFSLSARSRLDRRDINGVLKAIRRIDRRARRSSEVVATPGEIAREDDDHESMQDTLTDDHRVKIAVAWLEDAVLLRREENRVRIFPSSLKIRTLDEAGRLIDGKGTIPENRRDVLRKLVRCLIEAAPDKGVSTDELCGRTGMSPGRLRGALNDLESLGIASNDTSITVFVHLGGDDSSESRLAEFARLEADLVMRLREAAPDMSAEESSQLLLRSASQELRDAGHANVRPDIVERLVRGIARDGRDDDEGIGSLRVRKVNREILSLRLLRNWDRLAQTAELRRKGAAAILGALTRAAPRGARGKDVQVSTTLGVLIEAIASDIELSGEIKNPSGFLDRVLLWLHEQGIVALGQGLTIFRPAITVHLEPERRDFTDADFTPLELHYREQTLQTHIMSAYAQRGLASMPDALRLADDYFTLDREGFVKKWLPQSETTLQRQATPESWQAIVGDLGNPVQARIVADDRVQTNVLVLAGPGSGKTRVLVHRIAYLVRVRQENPRGILALVYNRHAATEIRQRLSSLLGSDARRVTVLTCHGLAMRLVGASFARDADKVDMDPKRFDEVLRQAVDLLQGKGLAKEEAEAQRDTLIEGYRWILVDEYQDVGRDEYNLVAAVAGRSLEDRDSRLSLFAVGDDDQNIYGFKGASVEYIRRFEKDYKARPAHLVENYRSTANIINASSCVIRQAGERMKADHDLVVNANRKSDPPGGELERLDAVGRGRVQILHEASTKNEQAALALKELRRLSGLALPGWDWTRAAVIAREWEYLEPVRSLCEEQGIPVQFATEKPAKFWRLRETQAFISWLKTRKDADLNASALADWAARQPDGKWWTLLKEGVATLVGEIGGQEAQVDRRVALEWLAEWSHDARRRQSGLLLLTAHRAKGLEFDDVVILDGGWEGRSRDRDPDSERRLYYVAMTRARRSLALLSMKRRHPIICDLDDPAFLRREPGLEPIDVSGSDRLYRTPELSNVDLSYAGRLREGHIALRALERLNIGDPIGLRQRGDRWLVVDQRDVPVGRLARSFKPPVGAAFVEGRVHAVCIWFREDGADEYREHVKRDRWPVVVPELVFRR